MLHEGKPSARVLGLNILFCGEVGVRVRIWIGILDQDDGVNDDTAMKKQEVRLRDGDDSRGGDGGGVVMVVRR